MHYGKIPKGCHYYSVNKFYRSIENPAGVALENVDTKQTNKRLFTQYANPSGLNLVAISTFAIIITALRA